jgi:transposase
MALMPIKRMGLPPRSLAADAHHCIMVSWLVAGMIPGVNREPLKKIAADPEVLLRLLYRWRDEAIKAGKEITRIAVGYETGRDSFWLARWQRDRGMMPT